MAITRFAMRHKRLVSLLLIVCVIFFNIYALQQQAHASAVVIGIGILVTFALTALIAMGVYFNSEAAAETAAEAVVYDTEYDYDLDGFADFVVNGATRAAEVTYNAVKDAWQFNVEMSQEEIDEWRDYVHSHYTAGTNYVDGDLTNQSLSVGSDYTYIINNGTVIYPSYCYYPSSGNYYYMRYYESNGDGTFTAYCNTYYYSNNALKSSYQTSSNTVSVYVECSGTNYTIYHLEYGGHINYFTVVLDDITVPIVESVDTGIYCDPDIYNDVVYDWANDTTGERELAVDLVTAPAGTAGDVTTSNGEVLVADTDAIYDWAVGAEAADVTAQDLSGVADTEAVVADPAEAITDYTTATEATSATETETSLKGLFLTKFPFCIPWDLANAFALIAAPSEAPHFEIDLFAPLNDRINFQGSTTISFDMADYPIIGQVSRWMFTIEFCIALMLVTRRVMKW